MTALQYIVRMLINNPTVRTVASQIARHAFRQATIGIIHHINSQTRSIKTVR